MADATKNVSADKRLEDAAKDDTAATIGGRRPTVGDDDNRPLSTDDATVHVAPLAVDTNHPVFTDDPQYIPSLPGKPEDAKKDDDEFGLDTPKDSKKK